VSPVWAGHSETPLRGTQPNSILQALCPKCFAGPPRSQIPLWNSRILHVMSLAARTLNSIPDEELVRLFQSSGEPDCFGELFARYRRRVYYACRGFFYEGSAAEDATQETFLRAFENLHTFVGGNFGGWLMRIAKNVCIDQWRKQKPEPGPADVELDKLPAAGAFDPTSDLHCAVEALLKEMQALSPEQRRCLELKIEGYSYDETAACTGLSIEAVKSHLQNGRRMLWMKMEGTLSQLK